MAITLDGTTGITTPASTVGGSAVLTTASSLASANLTGTVASARMPAGSVLQMQQSLDTAAYSIGANTHLGWSILITPASTSSKILLLWKINWSSTNPNGYLGITRDNGNLNPNISVANHFSGTGNFADLDEFIGTASNTYVYLPNFEMAWDSPATTSQVSYIMKIGTTVGDANVQTGRVNASGNYRMPSFQGIALEIAG